MKSFQDLQSRCRYDLRPALGEDAHPLSLKLCPPDDWPIGRNDMFSIAAWFSGGQIILAPLSGRKAAA